MLPAAAGEEERKASSTAAAPRQAQAAPRMHIRLGAAGSAIAYKPIYVAKEKELDEEEGLGVEFLWTRVAPEVIQATIGGSAEGGAEPPG